jgi:essential nuclear protein 1
MKYTFSRNVIIKVLIEKKYSLPSQVIDAITEYFYNGLKDKNNFPVYWHQTILSFIQTYKNDLTRNQKKKILDLIKVKKHQTITNLIRHELNSKTVVNDKIKTNLKDEMNIE